MKAYILLSTKPGTSLEVVQRIKEKVKEAIVADAIFGRYDAIIILEAPALENINQVVYKIIEKDPKRHPHRNIHRALANEIDLPQKDSSVSPIFSKFYNSSKLIVKN